MLKVDRAISWLLAVAVALHCIGTFYFFAPMSPIFVQSLSGGIAGFLVVALNLLRAGRESDRAIARLAMAGALAWAGIGILFGFSVGNPLDPRGLIHAVLALMLVGFGARTLRRIDA